MIMSDNQLLYLSSFLCIILIFISYKYNKQFAIISLIVFVLYSIYLYYGLKFKSEYGSALLWLFYLQLMTIIQIVISAIYIIVKLIRK